jgi:hypothetical protein
MAKPKPKKKQMTIEDFAIAIQRDLARMATKDDFRKPRDRPPVFHSLRDREIEQLLQEQILLQHDR